MYNLCVPVAARIVVYVIRGPGSVDSSLPLHIPPFKGLLPSPPKVYPRLTLTGLQQIR